MSKYDAPEVYARKTLDKLRELDQLTTAAYYEMGQLLSAIAHGKLYDLIGYRSVAQLVEEELSFTTSTAYKYLHTYRHFRRLKYNKTEAIKLLQKYGITTLHRVLPTLTQKVSSTTIRKKADALGVHQINFMLDDNEYAEFTKAVETLGGIRSDAGRLLNASELFMEMVRKVNANGNGGSKPKLKAVS